MKISPETCYPLCFYQMLDGDIQVSRNKAVAY